VPEAAIERIAKRDAIQRQLRVALRLFFEQETREGQPWLADKVYVGGLDPENGYE
jgi:hypothetical protein